VSNDQYVFTSCPTSGGDLDLSSLRGCAIADAAARFRAAGGRDVLLGPGLDTGVARAPLDALEIAFDWDRVPAVGDPAIERWAQWLIERLDAAKLIYHRVDGGWRLRTGKLHEENERRLGELDGWSEAALAGQRELLAHVDDPGDSGSELEQSLSKLAASGWKVDAKKDKGPPEVHFAAGDMPLAQGDDWRAAGTVHPRLAAALAFFLTAVPPAERESTQPGETATIAAQLPAIAVTGGNDAAALLDIRTIAKALRDVGALDLPSGEPLGQVVVHESFKLRAPRAHAETASASPNGSEPAAAPPAAAAAAATANDPVALIAAHDPEAVRFALLHAAAPGKRFRGGEDVVGYAAAFLARLREFATARLDGSAPGPRIDADDGLRRRLAGWCDTAVARTAENHERIDMHRATRNAIELLARIQDFDSRAAARDDGADREAIAVALTVLAQLLAPLAPRAAGDLWRQAGRDGAPVDAAWPSAQREPAAA
jgi:hypothetical protein